MLFDPFEPIVLFYPVLIIDYVVQDGRPNWFKGMILICLYTMTLPLIVPLFYFSLTRAGFRYVIVALVLLWTTTDLLDVERLNSDPVSPSFPQHLYHTVVHRFF